MPRGLSLLLWSLVGPRDYFFVVAALQDSSLLVASTSDIQESVSSRGLAEGRQGKLKQFSPPASQSRPAFLSDTFVSIFSTSDEMEKPLE